MRNTQEGEVNESLSSLQPRVRSALPTGVYKHDPYRHSPFVSSTQQPHFQYQPPRVASHYSVGSLGTPYIRGHLSSSGNLRGPVLSASPSSQRLSGSLSSAAHTRSNSNVAETEGILIIPTRPVLKTLAKQCRPFPPWCVGEAALLGIADEIVRFAAFMFTSPKEIEERDASLLTVHNIVQALWPGAAALQPMGGTAAGQPPTRDGVMHYYAANTKDEVAPEMIVAVANARGAQVQLGVDVRDCAYALFTDAKYGLRTRVRYGPGADAAGPCATCLHNRIRDNTAANAVLVVLVALLRQNKMFDDSGLQPNMLSGEALAVMVLAVMNAYAQNSADDEASSTDAGQLLCGFFQVYGFDNYFDPAQHSIVEGYLDTNPPLHHSNALLRVLDPMDSNVNLTASVDSAINLQILFKYCYTAVTQYAQVNANQHRAQSALSTILGGEPYWSRVFSLYEQGIEPYYSIVNSKRVALTNCL